MSESYVVFCRASYDELTTVLTTDDIDVAASTVDRLEQIDPDSFYWFEAVNKVDEVPEFHRLYRVFGFRRGRDSNFLFGVPGIKATAEIVGEGFPIPRLPEGLVNSKVDVRIEDDFIDVWGFNKEEVEAAATKAVGDVRYYNS